MALFRSLALVSLLAVALPVHAADTITARYIRTIDGDTFVADVIYPGGVALAAISIRIADVDTPELRDKRPEVRARAQAARDFTQRMLEKAHRIELREVRRGKYFRIVARVVVDGEDLGGALVREGLARVVKGN